MRLCHLLHYRPLGTRAIDHFILEYQRQARERGWQIRFGFTGEPPAEFASQIDWFEYRMPWQPDNDRDVAGWKPDVIVTSFHSAFEKPILHLKKIGLCRKLVIIDHSSGDGPPRDWKTPLRRFRGRRVGKIVDAVIAVSQFIATRDIERVFLPREKVHVVPNGIDLARFPFEEERTLSILYAGQLIEAKGVGTLIDALRILQQEGVTVPATIAGSGPLLETLKKQAATLANVTFAGHVSDIAKAYREAAIVVVPSVWGEAFGLVAIEAMASGAVVVSSDAGALREVIGYAGLVFKKGDAADLAAKLKTLMRDQTLLHSSRLRGRQRVEEQYQLADCVRKHLSIVASTITP